MFNLVLQDFPSFEADVLKVRLGKGSILKRTFVNHKSIS